MLVIASVIVFFHSPRIYNVIATMLPRETVRLNIFNIEIYKKNQKKKIHIFPTRHRSLAWDFIKTATFS